MRAPSRLQTAKMFELGRARCREAAARHSFQIEHPEVQTVAHDGLGPVGRERDLSLYKPCWELVRSTAPSRPTQASDIFWCGVGRCVHRRAIARHRQP